jgi:hypothetical protein
MLGLNPIIVMIGVTMNVIPIFAVITAISTCACLVIRHNNLEKEYINKNKLLIDILKDIDYEDVIKNEYYAENNTEEEQLLGDTDCVFDV